MKSLPADVVAYKRTPEFEASTVPAGLLRSHSTKAGTWGVIVVMEGALTYRILEPEIEDVRLDASTRGIVEPTVLHEVVPEPGVRFFVEFYRKQD